jgi:hypothetical protein
MKVHHILFLVWIIVFAFWWGKQFSRRTQARDHQLALARKAEAEAGTAAS